MLSVSSSISNPSTGLLTLPSLHGDVGATKLVDKASPLEYQDEWLFRYQVFEVNCFSGIDFDFGGNTEKHRGVHDQGEIEKTKVRIHEFSEYEFVGGRQGSCRLDSAR